MTIDQLGQADGSSPTALVDRLSSTEVGTGSSLRKDGIYTHPQFSPLHPRFRRRLRGHMYARDLSNTFKERPESI